ncbi:MAG TPA: MarR family winged helix-turn-helix transcriptional regulator [Pseudonocardiaceae bacterium]|nr:MarR family winged helix-turn-helix transcriptional regulator [Pseudonocardiaceae bacterium]
MTDLDPARLGDELMATTAALRRVVRRRLRPVVPGPALRGAQIEVLREVERRPGIGVAAVAAELRLAANSVSTLVNQLTDVGMLVRETDPDDRRAIRLQLTEAAARWLTDWRRERSALVRAGVAGLSGAEQEVIDRALPALRALLNQVEAMDLMEASNDE